MSAPGAVGTLVAAVVQVLLLAVPKPDIPVVVDYIHQLLVQRIPELVQLADMAQATHIPVADCTDTLAGELHSQEVDDQEQPWVHRVDELERLELRSRNLHMDSRTRRQVVEVQLEVEQRSQQRLAVGLGPSDLGTVSSDSSLSIKK